MVIDWMFLTYLIIGFFALIGFFRGWWKEAMTTLVLAILIVLLQQPEWAQALIDTINRIIAATGRLVARLLGFSIEAGEVFQLDASRASTWILVLILLLGLAALIARITLPGDTNRLPGNFYTVSPIGRVLGVLLGGLNGFLILGLFREYLDGRALPGQTPPDTQITLAGGSSFGAAASDLSIQAVNLPNFTILDTYIPWLIIGTGFLILLAVLRNRIRVVTSATGAGRKIEYVPPYGYKSLKADKPKEKDPPREVRVINQ